MRPVKLFFKFFVFVVTWFVVTWLLCTKQKYFEIVGSFCSARTYSRLPLVSVFRSFVHNETVADFDLIIEQ